MRMLTQAEKNRWAAQWRAAAKALAKVKRRELEAMTDDDVRKAISWVLADTINQYKDPRSQVYSGLVEQQRYFKRFYRKKRTKVKAV